MTPFPAPMPPSVLTTTVVVIHGMAPWKGIDSLYGNIKVFRRRGHGNFGFALEVTALAGRKLFPNNQNQNSTRSIAALEQGLRPIDDLLAREQLSHYHLTHSARAELCRRLGRIPEARASYEKALTLAPQESDRRFLARRLKELK